MSASGPRPRRSARIVVRDSLGKRLFFSRFLRSEFARHGLLVFASSTFVNFASYAFNFALSRWLGVAAYGVFASVVAGLILGSIPAAVLTTVVVKYSAELSAVGDEFRLAALARKALQGSVLIGVLASLSVIVLRHPIATYLRIGDERIIAEAGGILGLSFVVTMLRGVLQGTQRFRLFAFSTAIEGGLRGLLGVAAVSLGLGIIGPLLGWLVAEVAALGYVLWALPELRNNARGRDVVLLDWRRIVQSSGALAVSAIAMASIGFADMILVKHFFNAHIAGLYGGLSLCGRVFTFGLSFLPTIMLPKATARAMRGQAVLPILGVAGAISVTLAFVVISFVALSPSLALRILVGNAYSEAAPLVMPYCISVTFLMLTSLVITCKTAMHRFDFVVPLTLVALGEIVAIHAFHHTITNVVTVLIWGNLIALLSSCWRVWATSDSTHSTARRTREPHECGAVSNKPTVAALRIVIPAHNEEERIEPTVRDYCSHFADRAHITVVANACTDGSVAILRQLAGEYSNLDFVDIPFAIGKGGAVRVGFKSGEEPYVGFVDADGATTAGEFDRLFELCASSGSCGLIGSRWRRGATILRKQPLARRIASRVFNSLVRLLFNLPYHDTQCGAKIFRRSAIETAIAELELAGFAFDIDLLTNLRAQGCQVIEAATIWSDAIAGTTIEGLGRTSLTMLGGLIRLRLRRSFLARVPYVEWIAHESVIPVRDRLSLLVLRDNRTSVERSHRAYIEAALRAWELEGHSVTRIELSGVASRFATLIWYVFVSRRAFDAIVEERGSAPAFIPAFSQKTSYLVEDEPSNHVRPSLTRLAFDTLYRRSRRVTTTRHESGIVEAHLSRGAGTSPVQLHAFEELLEHVRLSGDYSAAFAQEAGSWHLTFREPLTNQPSRQSITPERSPFTR